MTSYIEQQADNAADSFIKTAVFANDISVIQSNVKILEKGLSSAMRNADEVLKGGDVLIKTKLPVQSRPILKESNKHTAVVVQMVEPVKAKI